MVIPNAAGIYQLDYQGMLYVGASSNIRKRVKEHLKLDSSSRWVWRLADKMLLDACISRQEAVATIVNETVPSVLQVFSGDFSADDLSDAEDKWIAKLNPALNDKSVTGGYKCVWL